MAPKVSRIQAKMLIDFFKHINFPTILKPTKFPLPFALVLVILYVFIIGRDRYTSTSSFIIVGSDSNDTSASLNGSLLVPGSTTRSYQDAKSLEIFLNSPRSYNKIFETFKNKYKSILPDFLSGIRPNHTFDSSYNFYKRQFKLTTDQSTGIITLTSNAFDPEISLALNKALLKQSNSFLDERNRNMYAYNVNFSKKELDSALQKLEIANKNLIDFKFVNGQLDETVVSNAASDYLAALQKSLVEEKVNLASMLRTFSSKDSPEINLSESKISSLKQEIKEETNRISGPKNNGLAARAIKSAQLKSLVELEQDNVSEMLLSLNQAKTNSTKKEKFISILSSPFPATKPDNGWKFTTIFTAFAFYLLLLGISKTIKDVQ